MSADALTPEGVAFNQAFALFLEALRSLKPHPPPDGSLQEVVVSFMATCEGKVRLMVKFPSVPPSPPIEADGPAQAIAQFCDAMTIYWDGSMTGRVLN